LKRTFLIVFLLTIISIQNADAAPGLCTVAETGTQRYDAVNRVMEFCNGTNWRLIGAPNKRIAACPSAAGQQLFNDTELFYNNSPDNMAYCKNNGTKTYYNTNCFVTAEDCLPATNKGKQRYNPAAGLQVMQYCDGAKWVNMGSVDSKPCCPDGFIPVPKDLVTGANQDFCVSRYHMKATKNDGTHIDGYDEGNAGDNFPASRPEDRPWTKLDFNDASDECDIFNGTYDFHIINNAEWMTIAKMIENNNLNWSGALQVVGAAGAFIPRGHSDNNPNNALAAPPEPNSLLGCDGINNLNCDNPANPNFLQKRTLILTNGQTIWDFAGNVNTWVASDDSESSLTYSRTACNPNVAPCTLELNAPYSLDPGGKYESINAPFMYPVGAPLATNNKLGFLPANDPVWATGINYGAMDYSLRGFGKITWLTGVGFSPQTMPYRGGYFNSQSAGGIYSIWITLNRGSNSANVGFRCVYKPTY
jgi:hypothetical protein